MNHLMESLEGRTLMSATLTTIFADEAKLQADVQQIAAQVHQYAPTFKTDATAVAADLKALPKSPANAKLLATLKSDQAKNIALASADFSKLIALNTKGMTKLFKDQMAVLAKPNNVAAKTKLATDASVFLSGVTAPLGKFLAQLGACGALMTQDAAALTTANPTATQLATDLATAKAHGAATTVNVMGMMETTQADLSQLMTDMAG